MSVAAQPIEALGPYRGLPILETKVIVNKTGDGLSKAVDVEPVDVEFNEKVYVAVELIKRRDRYDEVREDPKDPTSKVIGFTYVQVFDAVGIAFADKKLVGASINTMKEKVAARAAERKSKGQRAFDLGHEGDDEDDIDHDDPHLAGGNVSSIGKARRTK